MACTSKTELIDLTVKEFSKLRQLITPLDEVQASLGADGTSIRDVIGHRAHWIDLFLGWYSDGSAGKEVFFPAKGYKWNDLKRYNADLRKRQADLDWDAARALLDDRNDALVAFLTAKSDADLYSGPMQGAENTWTSGRWAEASGPSHYRSAAKFIRAVLRSNT
ncbi:ClbS/DfsB family four-helix bundle protein [uncultured Sulfitobacter sp.]|uniref:ClbS/DfsB family four-helix bundle protein n=1 Tax=uncultured Sulfitobacter sp. TaxID=191468 RepID=UPI002616522F|nr:ClbS/DfsB family four-helix bundle protein [uncultured Sulfitobacter sp.]